MKAKNGALGEQVLFVHVQAAELVKHRCVVQRLFHGRLDGFPLLLQEVDAQHRQ